MPPPRCSLPRLRPQDLLGCVGPPTRSAPSTPRLLVAPAPPLFSLRGSLVLSARIPCPPRPEAASARPGCVVAVFLSPKPLRPLAVHCVLLHLVSTYPTSPRPTPTCLSSIFPPSSPGSSINTLPAPRSHPPPHSLPAVSALASFFLSPYAPLCLGLWPSATSPPERVYHRPHSPFFPPLSSHSDLENK